MRRAPARTRSPRTATPSGCCSTFAQKRTGKRGKLEIEDLDAPLIAAFLDYLEHDRGNSPRTRNARLAAIHSMFRFAALNDPEHAALISRVLAVPTKRHDRAIVSYLTSEEVDALLAAPDRSAVDRTTRPRADHARDPDRAARHRAHQPPLHDLHLGTGPHVKTSGEGRRHRATPLTKHTVAVLREWLEERDGQPEEPLFPTSRGRALSRDAIALRLTKHASTASRTCPTLTNKTARHTRSRYKPR